MRLVTPLEMMKLEDKTNQSGVSYDAMMESAGLGLAEHLTRIAEENGFEEIVFLCGNGNNAGDCFVAASKLSKQFAVSVCMVAGVPKTRTAYTKFRLMHNVATISEHEEIKEAVRKASLIVDGIFGIGFRGELSPQIQEIFEIVKSDPAKQCVAVDIPSGGNGLNGSIAPGTPNCTATITFGAAKTGLFLSPLSKHCGSIFLVEIGIPESAFSILNYPTFRIDDTLVRGSLPARPNNSHKGIFGKLLGVAGSRFMPGAAILASQAALRCGVGLYCLASDYDVCRMLVAQTPESMILPLPSENGYLTAAAAPLIADASKDCKCVLIGCGLGQSEEVRELVCQLLKTIECPIILDADGLNAIADRIDILQEAKATVVLTPHPGEMARLMHCTPDEVQKDRMGTAKRLAAKFPNTVVVLKGEGTVVATAEHAYINTTGNSGMSKGGSGDVLAGMIGSLTAQGMEPERAAEAAVFLHGLAGDCAAAEFSKRAMLPTDLIHQLPLVFGEYD